jgi:(2Fe-2S) ferredoxin
LKTIEDLKQAKQKALDKIKLRQGKESIRIVVGMGTCGIAVGAREVMMTILDELGKRNLTDVTVSQTGCIGMCAKEPLIDVKVVGQPDVTYGNLDEAKVRQIVAQHIVNGIIVNNWVINKIRE